MDFSLGMLSAVRSDLVTLAMVARCAKNDADLGKESATIGCLRGSKQLRERERGEECLGRARVLVSESRRAHSTTCATEENQELRPAKSAYLNLESN